MKVLQALFKMGGFLQVLPDHLPQNLIELLVRFAELESFAGPVSHSIHQVVLYLFTRKEHL